MRKIPARPWVRGDLLCEQPGVAPANLVKAARID
jgi:hypothetical protein